MSGPDVENQHHWREKELEDELAIQEAIIDEMNMEIDRAIQQSQQRLDIELRLIQGRQRYREAQAKRDRIAIRLMEHRAIHGSYQRVVPENMLSDEEIQRREEDRRSEDSAHEAHERLHRAPGGSARRNSHMRTSPIDAAPQSPMRFATIGSPSSRSAFTTPPRINRSHNQEPTRNPNTSPVTTPPITRRVRQGQRGSNPRNRRRTNYSTSALRALPPLSSPGGDGTGRQGARNGLRQTRSADGARRRRASQEEKFKPTLKF